MIQNVGGMILSVTNFKVTHTRKPVEGKSVQPTVCKAMAAQVLAALKPVPVNPFSDVKETDFFHDSVLWAVEKGITDGIDETHFGPDESCTRAQVVTFLWRAMGSPAPQKTEHVFRDVEAGSFYENAVLWAVENGITDGLSDTAFGPNSVCNRSQVVTFLYRTYCK